MLNITASRSARDSATRVEEAYNLLAEVVRIFLSWSLKITPIDPFPEFTSKAASTLNFTNGALGVSKILQ